MGLKKDAESGLQQALQSSPSEPTIFSALTRVEMDDDKLPDADVYLRQYLKKASNDATSHYDLGRLLYEELRAEDATVEFQRSIDLQRSQPEVYYELGHIALDSGCAAEAKVRIRKSFAENPKYGGALTRLGIIASYAKDDVGPEQYLSAPVVYSLGYQPVHSYRGLSLANSGRRIDSDKELALAIGIAQLQ